MSEREDVDKEELALLCSTSFSLSHTRAHTLHMNTSTKHIDCVSSCKHSLDRNFCSTSKSRPGVISGFVVVLGAFGVWGFRSFHGARGFWV